MSQATWHGVTEGIRKIARREAADNGAGAERFLVKQVDPLKMESFHEDVTLKEDDDGIDFLHGLAADAQVGDTILVVTDRNGERVAVGRIPG